MIPNALQPVSRGRAVDLVRVLILAGLAAAVALGLAGCATRPPQLVEIRVPVPVPCQVATPARPAMPTDALVPAVPGEQILASIERKVKALLAELELREGYELELLAALQACTAPIPAH
jgi:hypothetical protein